jgi:uncharacterized membrane protein
MADRLSASFGSWSFILAQSVIVLVWIALNLAAWMGRWDPYPFILHECAAPIATMSRIA